MVMLCYAATMKVRTTVYLDEQIVDLLQARELNISEICREALESLAGVTSPFEMLRKAASLRAEADALQKQAEEIDASEGRLQALRMAFEKAKRGGFSERQNIDWLTLIRKKFGFARVPVKDLLASLQEEKE